MYLEILILSEIIKEPKHGYEIRTRVNTILAREKKINNNTLYPTLKRLKESGFITQHTQIQVGKPNKNVYLITDSGKKHFNGLISELPEELVGEDIEFFCRVSFFNLLDSKSISTILDKREDYIKQQNVYYNTYGSEEETGDSLINRLLIKDFLLVRLQDELTFVNSLRKKFIL